MTTGGSIAHVPSRDPVRRSGWWVPLIPVAVSVFFLAALATFRLRGAPAVEDAGLLQQIVLLCHDAIGFVPSLLFWVLVLSWSAIWFLGGELYAPLGRLARLAAFALALAVLVNLGHGAGLENPPGGATGEYLATRLDSVFGSILSALVVVGAALAGMLLATDFLFYRYFESLGRRNAGRAAAAAIAAPGPGSVTGPAPVSPAVRSSPESPAAVADRGGAAQPAGTLAEVLGKRTGSPVVGLGGDAGVRIVSRGRRGAPAQGGAEAREPRFRRAAAIDEPADEAFESATGAAAAAETPAADAGAGETAGREVEDRDRAPAAARSGSGAPASGPPAADEASAPDGMIASATDELEATRPDGDAAVDRGPELPFGGAEVTVTPSRADGDPTAGAERAHAGAGGGSGDDRPAGAGPAGHGSADDLDRAVADRAAGDLATEDRAAEDWVAEDRATEDRVAEDRATEDRVAEGRATEEDRVAESRDAGGTAVADTGAGSTASPADPSRERAPDGGGVLGDRAAGDTAPEVPSASRISGADAGGEDTRDADPGSHGTASGGDGERDAGRQDSGTAVGDAADAGALAGDPDPHSGAEPDPHAHAGEAVVELPRPPVLPPSPGLDPTLVDAAAALVQSTRRASATFVARRLAVDFEIGIALLEALRLRGILDGEPGSSHMQVR